MSRFNYLVAAFALAALLAGTAFEAKATEYIANGGFETGDFTGWTTNFTGGTSVASGGLYTPNSGSYYAALGGIPTSTLSQTFTDVSGATLQVSFYLANNVDPIGSEFGALFNGIFILSYLSPVPATSGYVHYSYTETATGSDTLQFNFFDVVSTLALDDVSVTDVPASTPLPAALPLFATGLGALGLLTWRRKRKNATALITA